MQLVHLDVSRHEIGQGFVDKAKVSEKNKPTFLLRADNSLHKVRPEHLRSEFPQGLKHDLLRVSGSKPIWRVKDLAEALRVNNTELDSLTVVYCHDLKSKEEFPSVAMRVMRHESQH